MKQRLMLLFVVIFTGCTYPHIVQSNYHKMDDDASAYMVYKIDSLNTYYLIYAERSDTLYKIVSKKEEVPNCVRIRMGEKYLFVLNSIWNKSIMIGNVNVSPSVTPHVDCLQFDDSTRICLEKDSINDLFRADNIQGLCFRR